MRHLYGVIWCSLAGLSLMVAGCGDRPTVPVESGRSVEATATAKADAASTPASESVAADALKLAIEHPGKVEGHQIYLDYLLTLKEVDPVQLENQKWIIDAFAGKYPQKWPQTHWSLASVLNHQAWHLIVNGRESAYAEALVSHSLSLQPSECDFLDTLAELRFRQGAVKKALLIIGQAQKQKTDRGRPMGKSKKRYLEKQKNRFHKALK